MPYLHVYDSQLPVAGALAGNVGLYDTGQNQFSNNLRANADARAQQAADQSGQDAADRLDLQNRQLDSQNANFAAGLDNKVALRAQQDVDAQELANIKAKQRTQQLTQQETARMAELDAKLKSAGDINTDKINSREGIYYNGQQPYNYYKTDTQAGTAKAGQDNQQQIAQMRIDAANSHAQAIAAERQLELSYQANVRSGQQAQAIQIKALQAAIGASRSKLAAAARNSDDNGVAAANNELKGLLAQFGNIQPAQPPSFNPGTDQGQPIQSAPGAVGQAGIIGPPQPTSSAPTHIRDGSGTNWVFTGQYDPQSGEPIYSSQ